MFFLLHSIATSYIKKQKITVLRKIKIGVPQISRTETNSEFPHQFLISINLLRLISHMDRIYQEVHPNQPNVTNSCSKRRFCWAHFFKRMQESFCFLLTKGSMPRLQNWNISSTKAWVFMKFSTLGHMTAINCCFFYIYVQTTAHKLFSCAPMFISRKHVFTQACAFVHIILLKFVGVI